MPPTPLEFLSWGGLGSWVGVRKGEGEGYGTFYDSEAARSAAVATRREEGDRVGFDSLRQFSAAVGTIMAVLIVLVVLSRGSTLSNPSDHHLGADPLHTEDVGMHLSAREGRSESKTMAELNATLNSDSGDIEEMRHLQEIIGNITKADENINNPNGVGGDDNGKSPPVPSSSSSSYPVSSSSSYYSPPTFFPFLDEEGEKEEGREPVEPSIALPAEEDDQGESLRKHLAPMVPSEAKKKLPREATRKGSNEQGGRATSKTSSTVPTSHEGKNKEGGGGRNPRRTTDDDFEHWIESTTERAVHVIENVTEGAMKFVEEAVHRDGPAVANSTERASKILFKAIERTSEDAVRYVREKIRENGPSWRNYTEHTARKIIEVVENASEESMKYLKKTIKRYGPTFENFTESTAKEIPYPHHSFSSPIPHPHFPAPSPQHSAKEEEKMKEEEEEEEKKEEEKEEEEEKKEEEEEKKEKEQKKEEEKEEEEKRKKKAKRRHKMNEEQTTGWNQQVTGKTEAELGYEEEEKEAMAEQRAAHKLGRQAAAAAAAVQAAAQPKNTTSVSALH
eukprot:jgi/Bigna1/71919/fgenesh1_pg.17_\